MKHVEELIESARKSSAADDWATAFFAVATIHGIKIGVGHGDMAAWFGDAIHHATAKEHAMKESIVKIFNVLKTLRITKSNLFARNDVVISEELFNQLKEIELIKPIKNKEESNA